MRPVRMRGILLSRVTGEKARMKITVLMENTSHDDSLVSEHGISLYIETSEDVILFDSGQSGRIVENAAKLGIDLGKVDIAVLSHGHYDHSGGFLRFFEVNGHAKLYMNRAVFGDYRNRTGKFIGVDKRLGDSKRIVFTGDEFQIRKGLSLYTCNDRKPVDPIDSAGLSVSEESTKPDTFRHEHYLLIEEEDRKVLISGCSHKGILNIEEWFQPDYLLGGFHFKDVSLNDAGRKRLGNAARKLLEYDTEYFTGHCTGVEQYKYMKQIMGDRLDCLYTGRVVEIKGG